MASPLTSFAGVADPYGELRLQWVTPTIVNPYKVFIFKKRGSSVTDQTITDYLDGQPWGEYGLTDEALRTAGVMVFRDIPNAQKDLFDFDFKNGETYYYRALIAENNAGVTDIDIGETIDLSLTAAVQVKVRIIDGKKLIIRALERMILSVKAIGGTKPIIGKDIKVHGDYAREKGEDFWITVQRTAGQNIERYLDTSYITMHGSSFLKGEVDIDPFAIEWIATSYPRRRDKFTDIARGFRPLLHHYIMKMGFGYVRDARIIMGGDAEGQTGREEFAVMGKMTIILYVQSHMEIGRMITSGIEIDTDYEGDEI